jgi:hypothetical protein
VDGKEVAWTSTTRESPQALVFLLASVLMSCKLRNKMELELRCGALWPPGPVRMSQKQDGLLICVTRISSSESPNCLLDLTSVKPVSPHNTGS